MIVSIIICLLLIAALLFILNGIRTNFSLTKEQLILNGFREVCKGWKQPYGPANVVVYDVEERNRAIPVNWQDDVAMAAFCAPYALVKFRVSDRMVSENKLKRVDCDKAPTRGDGKTVCRSYPICMLPPDKDAISSHVNQTGVWEENHLIVVARTLESMGGPKEVFMLDAGTNQAIYSLWASFLGYRVVGFEANAKLMPLLRRSFSLAGVANRILLFNNAISHRRDSVILQEEEGNIGASVIREKGSSVKGVSVEQITLDDCLNAIRTQLGERKKLGYMKIDVEGHEAKLFTGGVLFMQHYLPRHFQMEINTIVKGRTTWDECDCERFVSITKAFGYTRHDNFWKENSTFCQTQDTFGESFFTMA